MNRFGSTILLVALSAFVPACGDDTASSGGGGSGAGGTTGGGGETAGGSDSGGTGTGGTADGGSGGHGTGGANLGPEALAVVRGALFTADLAEAKAAHDAVAMAGEAPAAQAGDIAHDPYLGTTLLGSPENQFLALDRWSSDANMDAFYSNPDFQSAFGALFAAPPTFETFIRSDFHQWGDLDAADATSPHFAIVVRGHLADDPAAIKAQHDAIASGGEETANGLGDVAHVVYLGRQDPREVVLIDLWTTSEPIEAFYSNPDFQNAVGSLFDAPPTVAVYGSTDWYGW